MKYELSRDYSQIPIDKGIMPPYADLYKCMITYLLPKEDIAEIFGVKPFKIEQWARKYGIKRTKEQITEIRKKTNLKKYGVEAVSQAKEFKEKTKQTYLKHYGVDNPNKLKEVRDKIKQTNLQKYGVEHPSQSQEIKDKTKKYFLNKYGIESANKLQEKIDKCKNTNLEKYGVSCNLHSEEGKRKTIETNMKKYGCAWGLQAQEIQDKSKQTCMEKWGTNNTSNAHLSPETLEIIHDRNKFINFINTCEPKTIKTISEKLGLSYTGVQYKLSEFNCTDLVEHYTSEIELEIGKLFPNFHRTRNIISPYEIDLYNPDLKLGIEFNGDYWHSEQYKEQYYHQMKSNMAKEKDVFIYHIFEHEWWNDKTNSIIKSQLNNLMGKNEKYYARKCDIKQINYNDCCSFLEENHIQGKDNSSIRYGLYLGDKLVCVMTFCKPRFNKNYEYELSRFCSLKNTTIVGGATRLFKHFVKTINPNSVITYSDCAKTKGTLYPKLGFQFVRQTVPNYWWIKQNEVLSRYQCQKHKLLEYSEYGSTETEIMKNRGYLRVYDCGNYVWVWYKA